MGQAFSSPLCDTRENNGVTLILGSAGKPHSKMCFIRAPTESLEVGQGVGESLGETRKYCVWSLSVAYRERIYIKNSRDICKGLSIFFLEEKVTKNVYSPGWQRPTQGRSSLREILLEQRPDHAPQGTTCPKCGLLERQQSLLRHLSCL